MTQLLFPTLSGISFPVVKTPQWLSSKTVFSQTGIASSTVSQQYPTFLFDLPLEFIQDKKSNSDELHTLMAFYNSVRGSTDDFMFNDISNNSCVLQNIGTGNGVTTTFQLSSNYGGFVAPIYAFNNATLSVYLNGTSTVAYTVSNYGLVTFTTPPANGTVITASFTFYHRVKFLDNSIPFENFLSNIWEVKSIKLQSVKVRT